MPRNGFGTYSRAVTPPNNGDVANADDFNDEMDDIATALSNSLAKNGETIPTANLPMGGFVLTGLGAGDANGESVRYEQISPLFRFGETVLSPTIVSGFLYGLTLSNNSGDATNDIDIAPGIAIDGTNVKFLNLASPLTKRLDAAWAVGTNQGGLDTGSPANTTYHVWLIMRSDTGVVDALLSTSPTSPTMPANYDYKRRIGAIMREGGAIVGFVQDGDLFMRKTPVSDIAATNPGTSAVTRTVSLPLGIRTQGLFSAHIETTTTGDSYALLLSDLSATDTAASLPYSQVVVGTLTTAGNYRAKGVASVFTNTSSQIRSRLSVSDANTTIGIQTYGWIDTRGRLGA